MTETARPLPSIVLITPFGADPFTQRLVREVLFWRETALAQLTVTACELEINRGDNTPAWRHLQRPERRFRELALALKAALEDDVYQECEACDVPIRPGDLVVSCADVGEIHASCAGATNADIAAGRMAVPIESLSLDELEPENRAAVEADPHLRIYPSRPAFEEDEAQRILTNALALLPKLEPNEDERACRICGCTEDRACSTDDGPCAWFSEDVCTACIGQASPGVAAIAKERQRQFTVEGWTPEHDDTHDEGQLARAAANYAAAAGAMLQLGATGWETDAPYNGFPFTDWPWAEQWWKPSDPRGTLVKAGGLIAAEIDRIDRAASEVPPFLTAHEAAESSCRRHARQDGDAEVTAESWPTIFDAFETISHDSGFSAGHSSYFVPAAWVGELNAIEAVLAAMDPDERENNFVLGEGSEVEALVAARPELNPAHKLLNAFFDDFHGAGGADHG